MNPAFSLKREFVASVYIINNNQTLLHFHKKLKKWLPPGGHLEINETPEEAAIREVKEETGLEVELVQKEKKNFHYENTKSLIVPYRISLENIPKFKNIEEHQHIDFIFVATTKNSSVLPLAPFQWFSLEEIEKLPENEILPDVLQVSSEILELSKHSFV